MANAITLHVEDQKVVPLPEREVLLARSIQVCEDQDVKFPWIKAIL